MQDLKNSFLKDILIDPDSGNPLVFEDNRLIEPKSNKSFLTEPVIDLRPSRSVENEVIPDYIDHYEKDAENFDYFNEQFGEDTLEDFKRLRQYVYSQIPKEADNVLDAGSGGAWLAKMLHKTGKKVISFDISAKNVAKALEAFNFKDHFGIAGDAMQPPFKDNSIDCIVSSEVIEHLPEPTLFVKNLLKVLKPGGKFIVSTPYKEKLRYEMCVHCNKPTPRNGHLHSFDVRKLLDLAGENISGFEYFTFGNKALIVGQFHHISRHFNFDAWKFIDTAANNIINKRAHIIAVYTK